ncbi:MAG TPA: P-type conjugative transfer protein TrbL [Steroidobacteraceae bacterium]|nr:P-type conjugative transfer protein TrbL [Steroidobacteraceae bacterium]
MNDLGVIDHFTAVFSKYIDSGFGLLGNEITFLTATLVAIDMTLAGLFWAMGGEDVIAKLIKKTLYVGAFAYIINNFNSLAGILFKSFAGLGLTASGSTLTQAQFLQPGHLASVGVDAAHPVMQAIGQLTGFPDVFANLDTIAVLFIAWLIVIVSFFVLAVQLFITLIEFKLTTLAGFVLVPFALWNKTAFLAERVLGNVVSSGIKVLVLAVIVGIGTGIFGEFTTPAAGDMTIDNALAIMLAALAMLGLGIFGPSIANGLVSGAPQLGAGAAAGTLMGAGGLAVASGAAVAGGARLAGAAARSSVGAATSMNSGARAIASTYREGVNASGLKGAAGVAAGVQNLARAGASAIGQGIRSIGNKAPAASAETTGASQAPNWAKRMQTRQRISQGVSQAAQSLRSGDHGGSGANPKLNPEG